MRRGCLNAPNSTATGATLTIASAYSSSGSRKQSSSRPVNGYRKHLEQYSGRSHQRIELRIGRRGFIPNVIK